MAYDEFLADRMRSCFQGKALKIEERKMFGGLCFMVDDKMCVGIVKQKLMVRLDPDYFEEALAIEGCEPMDFTGKSMKGFVFISPEFIDMDEELEFWMNKALEYNPKAKASKRK